MAENRTFALFTSQKQPGQIRFNAARETLPMQSGGSAMTHFKLVRYRNGDFVLSAGSRLPVAATAEGRAPAEAGTKGSHPADLLISAGNGLLVDAA
jgi:hypothetical protein